jgi:hypothetical protein
VAFPSRTVNVQIRLRFCVNERGCFDRLGAIIRSTVGVFACVFAVEKRRVGCGVTAQVVQMYLSAQ